MKKRRKKSRKPDEESTPRTQKIIRRGVRKRFPELTNWFRWLNGGYQKGIDWQPLLISYVGRIGETRAERLCREAGAAQQVALPDEAKLDVLVYGFLGLDVAVPEREGESPEALLGAFEQLIAEMVHLPS